MGVYVWCVVGRHSRRRTAATRKRTEEKKHGKEKSCTTAVNDVSENLGKWCKLNCRHYLKHTIFFARFFSLLLFSLFVFGRYVSVSLGCPCHEFTVRAIADAFVRRFGPKTTRRNANALQHCTDKLTRIYIVNRCISMLYMHNICCRGDYVTIHY